MNNIELCSGYNSGIYSKISNLLYNRTNILHVMRILNNTFSREIVIKCHKNYLKVYIRNTIIKIYIVSIYENYNIYQKMYDLLYRI